MVAFSGQVTDLTFGMITGADASLSASAAQSFSLLINNPLLGLYSLDFLNAILTVIGLVFAFGLYTAIKPKSVWTCRFALILSIMGTVLMLSVNAAPGMLELAHKYAASADSIQQDYYLAAGEALLVRGAHGSLTAFSAFVFPLLANIFFSITMFSNRSFGRVTAILGLVGHLFMIIYMILVTFIPAAKEYMMIIVAPGGLLAMAWFVRSSLSLLSRKTRAEILLEGK